MQNVQNAYYIDQGIANNRELTTMVVQIWAIIAGAPCTPESTIFPNFANNLCLITQTSGHTIWTISLPPFHSTQRRLCGPGDRVVHRLRSTPSQPHTHPHSSPTSHPVGGGARRLRGNSHLGSGQRRVSVTNSSNRAYRMSGN